MMERRDILPGVKETSSPPEVVFDSSRSVRKARQRATLLEMARLALMAAVDFLFIHFPGTHIPFMNRHHSVQILVVSNGLMIFAIVLARTLPRWRARRIAQTWAAGEKTRFRTRA